MMFSTNLQILFCGNARIMENPSGLPQSFGKAFGFPTFHTKPFTIKKGNYNCRQRGIIVDINHSVLDFVKRSALLPKSTALPLKMNGNILQRLGHRGKKRFTGKKLRLGQYDAGYLGVNRDRFMQNFLIIHFRLVDKM
jgi:hypothetical protein